MEVSELSAGLVSEVARLAFYAVSILAALTSVRPRLAIVTSGSAAILAATTAGAALALRGTSYRLDFDVIPMASATMMLLAFRISRNHPTPQARPNARP